MNLTGNPEETNGILVTGDDPDALFVLGRTLEKAGFTVELAGSGDETLEKMRHKFESSMRQAQKLEAIGTMAGGIAHDFNNILSSIIGFTELSLEEAARGTLLEDNLKEIYAAGLRAKDLVRQILTFARQTEERVRPISISPIIKESVKFLRSSAPSTIDISYRISTDACVMADPTRIHQVLMNLFTNAVQAMESGGGRLSIDVSPETLDDTTPPPMPGMPAGEYLRLKVADTGNGIPLEIQDKIFEPYVTTKEEGEGTGLGLATVHGIVTSCQGYISVESRPGEGACFTIHLPTTPYFQTAAPEETRDLPTGSERLLFVDDEMAIVKMGVQILERLGYRVESRISSPEALALFESKPDAFDLVITDMTMPEMTGDRLAALIKEIRPDIPVILCTGFSKKIMAAESRMKEIDAIFFKPISTPDLAQTVRRVLDEAANLEN